MAQLKLMPPVFASEDFVSGYRMGLTDRLREARNAIEELRLEGALSLRDALEYEMSTED